MLRVIVNNVLITNVLIINEKGLTSISYTMIIGTQTKEKFYTTKDTKNFHKETQRKSGKRSTN